jgi:CBS domain-containing protein
MQTATKPNGIKAFLGLTAADLMSAPMITIPHDMLLRDAGHLLLVSNISGAPVVDAEGNCVGILSSSDFVNLAETGPMPERRMAVSFIAPWGEIIGLDACEGCIVSQYMTKDPVKVTRTTPIGEIAQMMIDAHIHRVLVANGCRPCGIVTGTDIIAAVANLARKDALTKIAKG